MSAIAGESTREVYIALFRGQKIPLNSPEGIPVLANKIKLLKLSASRIVKEYESNEATELAADIQKRWASSQRGRLILIGHSAGADSVLEFVYRYGKQIHVDYAITLDPVGNWKVLSNNVPGRNYYTTLGLLHGHPVTGAENVDLTRRQDTCVMGEQHAFTHTIIDDCELIQSEVAALVRQTVDDASAPTTAELATPPPTPTGLHRTDVHAP